MITSKYIYGADKRDFVEYMRGSGNTVEIRDILVMSERRRGVGRKLIIELLSRMPAEFPECHLLWALTRAENKIAQEFYEAMGFRLIGGLFDFYKDTPPSGRVDAVMYGRVV